MDINKQPIENIVQQTVDATISKLIMAGLMTNQTLSAVQRTEQILKNYTLLKNSVRKNKTSENFLNLVDVALDNVKSNSYYDIIPLIYFEGKTREQVAEFFDTSVRTVNRRKKKLLENMAVYIFPDAVLNEII